MATEESESSANRYGIGVVSRLTGVSRDALRVWEKRYGVVQAARTESKRRLYSQDDIKRLMLVKALVDSGHPISSVANLGTGELEERLQSDAAVQPNAQKGLHEGPVRVVLIGPSLKRLVQANRIGIDGLEILAEANQLEELETPLDDLEVDVLVIEYRGLFDETIDEVKTLIERSRARRAILVYGFTSQRVVASMRKNAPGVLAIPAPINSTELRLACLMDVNLGRDDHVQELQIGQIPDRVFTDEELAHIASASSTIQCECPHHLVTLISSLTAFEHYSESCEKQNAADAALHSHLHSVAARSRRVIEDALRTLAEAEDLLPK